MSQRYRTQWFSGASILPEHSSLPVRQVYAWLLTDDLQVVVVSKDGASWQLPGGKPAAGETHTQTMLREVKEETGLDLDRTTPSACMVGYYLVEDLVENATYLQLRMYLRLPENDLHLTIDEPEGDPEQGKIRYTRLFPLDEITRIMPWSSAEKDALPYSLYRSSP